MRFTCIAVGFPLFGYALSNVIRALSNVFPTSSLLCPSYFCCGFPLSLSVTLCVSTCRHLFTYAWFACIRLTSLLFPVRFVKCCSVHSSIRIPHAFPRDFLVGSLLHGSPMPFLVRYTVRSLCELPSRFPMRSPCIPRAFPCVFGSCSLTFSNELHNCSPVGPCNNSPYIRCGISPLFPCL